MPRYIDADVFEVFGYTSQDGTFDDGVQFVLEKIDEQPIADVIEVKHGEWKHTVTGYPYCSNCDWMPEEDEMLHTNYYCPNCGAKMDGGKEK